MECSICLNTIKDKIYMTCNSKHEFCFKCIIQNVSSNEELKYCPNCRGGDKFIMISNENSDSTGQFDSLKYFKECLPIIQKANNDTISNSCLVSEKTLLFYIKNKKQLEMAKKLIDNGETIENVSKYIKWDGNMLNDLFKTTQILLGHEPDIEQRFGFGGGGSLFGSRPNGVSFFNGFR